MQTGRRVIIAPGLQPICFVKFSPEEYPHVVLEELDLLQRARALDEEALTEIHNRYYGAIYRYISFRVNDVHTVEDLTSEVFTRFLSAIRDKHAPRNTIEGWLYGASALVVKEHYRLKKRSRTEALHEHLPSQAMGPERRAEKSMTLDQLRSALYTLTEEQQHVLALRFGQGLPISDVARIVNKSEGAVKMLQARAVAALTRSFEGAEVSR